MPLKSKTKRKTNNPLESKTRIKRNKAIIKATGITKGDAPSRSSLYFWLKDATLHELRQHPERIKQLADEMRRFGHEVGTDLDEFCLRNRFSRNKLGLWRDALPELEEAAQEMKEAIHIRRRMIYFERNPESNYLRYAETYCKDEKAINDRIDARKKDSAQESGIVFIRDSKDIVTGKIKPRESTDE